VGATWKGPARHIAVRGCCVAHVEDDKVITHQQYYDQLELCSQLDLPYVSEQVA
jgi:hypothetical protein